VVTTQADSDGGALEALARVPVADHHLEVLAAAPALAEATSLTAIARAAFEQGVRTLGAAAGVLTLLDDSGTQLELVAATGYSPEYLRDWRRFPAQLPTPIGDAVRQRRTVVVGSLAELRERYPHIRLPDERPHALIAFPVEVEGDVVGGVGLRFDVDTIAALGQRDLELAAGLSEAAAARFVEARLVDRLRTTVEQLQRALDSRVVIEQAKGILAGRHGVTPDAAFKALRRLARERNLRLHDLAQQRVDEVSAPPPR
jgi:hypothetical protein